MNGLDLDLPFGLVLIIIGFVFAVSLWAAWTEVGEQTERFRHAHDTDVDTELEEMCDGI